jgi:hypothetical protein
MEFVKCTYSGCMLPTRKHIVVVIRVEHVENSQLPVAVEKK